jgi:hypothetical protein
MGANLGIFDRPEEPQVAVEEQPRCFHHLERFLQTPPETGEMSPSPGGAARAGFADLAISDRRVVKYAGKSAPVLPSVRTVTGSALKAMVGAYRRAILFIKNHEGGWKRVDDNEAVDLSGGEEFRAEAPKPRFTSVPRLSRD